MTFTINARPHINGLEPDQFAEAARKLYTRTTDLEEEIQKVTGLVLHGRSYQHLGSDAYSERQKDLALVKHLMAQVSGIKQFAYGIAEAGETK